METKQTAVNWLVNVVQSCIAPNYIPKEIIEQALQMEREQIIESFMEGTKMDNINNELSARFNACIYYGEKFGGQDE
jgi:hydroxymethylglutaryl-CoA reductase